MPNAPYELGILSALFKNVKHGMAVVGLVHPANLPSPLRLTYPYSSEQLWPCFKRNSTAVLATPSERHGSRSYKRKLGKPWPRLFTMEAKIDRAGREGQVAACFPGECNFIISIFRNWASSLAGQFCFRRAKFSDRLSYGMRKEWAARRRST